MNAVISETIKVSTQRKFDSSVSHAHKPPNTVVYTFNARIKILTEIYCFHQYLSIDPKKSLHRPQTAHKLQIIVNMTADISETIIGRELGFQI